MKLKIKLPKRGGLLYNIAPAMILTLLVLCIIFAIKGIFPFGSDSVAYMDMWQMNVPVYYHCYDALHGDKSMFYDLYTGLGMNMSESTAICSLLSPFNLLFYLIPRHALLNFLPIYTAVKIIASAGTMAAFLRYRFKKTHVFWRTLASFAYGLCGLNMMFCTNSQWLDMTALLPLVMLALDYSMKNHKVLPYGLALGLYFIVNPYIGIVTLLFIFLTAATNIVFLVPKKEKALSILHLGIGTACGVGISAFTLLPFMKQMNQTSRVSNDLSTTIINILNGVNPYPTTEIQKYWMMWGTALACAFIIYGVIVTRKRINRNICTLLCTAYMILPIFFENINLIWHGGSYVLFPMRFGFMTSFIVWTAAMSYCNEIPEINSFASLRKLPERRLFAVLKIAFSVIWGLFCIAFIPIAAYYLSQHFRGIGSDLNDRKIFSLIIFGILAVFYLVFINKRNATILRFVICSVLVAEMSAGVYLFIGAPYVDPFFGSTFDFSYDEEIRETREAFDLSDSKTVRVKNSDTHFTSNYPMMMKSASLSNWTHSVSADIQQAYRSLGYSIIYTRLVDSGGTAFLDALMNIEDVLTFAELPEKSYTYVEETDILKHYKTNYAFGFGTVMSESAVSISDLSNYYDKQNGIYRAMGGYGDILHPIQVGGSIDSSVIVNKEETGNTVNYTINVDGCQNLYLAGMASVTISVNNQPIVVPNQGFANYTFPASYNNGTIDLGVYENETIELSINYTTGINESFLSLCLLSYDNLDALMENSSQFSAKLINEGKNSFELQANANGDDSILLIPLTYDKGINCKVNGKKAKTEKVIGCFTAVHLSDGDNIIKISYMPDRMKGGILISVFSLTALVLYSVLVLKKKEPRFKLSVRAIAAWEFAKLLVIFVTILYVIPMIWQIFKLKL